MWDGKSCLPRPPFLVAGEYWLQSIMAKSQVALIGENSTRLFFQLLDPSYPLVFIIHSLIARDDV